MILLHRSRIAMATLFFLSCFFLFKFSSAYLYVHQDLGWNVTNDYQYSLSNGRSYKPTGLGFRNIDVTNNATIKFRLVFLGDQRNDLSNLSIVAWDEGMEDIADVIWSANVTFGINATLLFQHTGSLVLTSQKNEIIWSTSTANTGVYQIWFTEYGALRLVDTNNNTVWSSFNSPTNKLVCGQVLTPGLELAYEDYSFKAEEMGATLYFLQHPYQTWNTTYDNSTYATFVTLCCTVYGANLQLRSNTVNIRDDGYYWGDCTNSDVEMLYLWVSQTGDPSYVAAVTLEGDGLLTITKLSVQSSNFQGNDTCNLPNKCGQYGLCSSDGNCICPLNSTYFKAIDGSNQAAGCEFAAGYIKYNKSGTCEMINQPRVDYYETKFSSPSQTGISEEVCYKSCYNSSTCNAAFYHLDTKNCFMVDQIYSLKYANNSYSASFKLCKQSTASSLSSKRSHAVLIAATTAGISCFIVLMIALFVWLKVRAIQEGEEEDGILSSYLSETTLRRFSLKELDKITSSFSEKLGNGAFGSVYKGQLPNGNFVAVKTLNGASQEAKDFYAEVSILSRVRHFNLVQLLGFCSNRKTRALVYEYMANGSLDQHLLGKKSSLLSWETRMEIALGSARGMAYLHEDCSEKVLHLDVKPQNILLDKNFCPKVSDFGLSRLLDRAENHFFMTTICGTPGYLAPELIKGEAIGVESDVYSFGVVLLEILAGARPLEPKGQEFWNISSDDNVVDSLVDSRLGKAFNLEEARRMIRIAALCINHDPDLRPHMSSIVQMLEGNIEIPQFREPQFYPNIRASTNAKFMNLLESRSHNFSSSQAVPSTSLSTPVLAPR